LSESIASYNILLQGSLMTSLLVCIDFNRTWQKSGYIQGSHPAGHMP